MPDIVPDASAERRDPWEAVRATGVRMLVCGHALPPRISAGHGVAVGPATSTGAVARADTTARSHYAPDAEGLLPRLRRTHSVPVEAGSSEGIG